MTRIIWDLGSLRVWNDDEIAPNTGFPPHPHANTGDHYLRARGRHHHKDNLGNAGRIVAGDGYR